ncbi:MAG: hypothetical protein OHK0046_22180 [Anaerolineae bacterium]
MPSDAQSAAEAYKAVLEGKIQKVVVEFAEGKLSRAQFQVLYERYNSQLAIATHAIYSGNPDAIQIAQNGLPTLVVRDAYEGKAIGLLIYHHKSSTILETLGTFEVPIDKIHPTLSTFKMLLEAQEFVEQRAEQLNSARWLLYTPGKATIIVTLFHNEPSAQQMREIERLQHDFEQANHLLLQKDEINARELAYPFVAFIEKKLGK